MPPMRSSSQLLPILYTTLKENNVIEQRKRGCGTLEAHSPLVKLSNSSLRFEHTIEPLQAKP